MPTKRRRVIQDVILAMESGELKYSLHALTRMKERGILVSDLEEAIYNSQREESKDVLSQDGSSWKYALRGKNCEEDKDLRIIVAFDGPEVVVITVIDKSKDSNHE